MSKIVLLKKISERILLIRGEKVILDSDLAAFYGVTTKRLNEQVKRNRGRFPADFVFQLSAGEKLEVVAKCDHLAKLKFSKTRPFAFTEHGALMAASVLSSRRAIQASVLIVRTFVQLRRILALNPELSYRLKTIEERLVAHDAEIDSLVEVLRQLNSPRLPPKRRIGFAHSDSKIQD